MSQSDQLQGAGAPGSCPSLRRQVRCFSPAPPTTAVVGSQMLPLALVLQNQCLLPWVLSQCPYPSPSVLCWTGSRCDSLQEKHCFHMLFNKLAGAFLCPVAARPP